jgi:glycosyltransferase involved in cell wall biosynthesis
VGCEAQDESTHLLSVVQAVRSDAFAGVERYVAIVSSALAARGHHVTVVGGDPAAMRHTIADPTVKLVPAARTSSVALALANHARYADIMHVHMTAAEFAALAARPVVRAPIVATRHFARRRGSTLAGRALAPLIERMLVDELAISAFVADRIGVPSTVLLNGVARADAVDPSARVVLVAQRLEPEKRTADALLAWGRTRLAFDGWELLIAGDGSERRRLESEAERRHVSGVRFLGLRHDVARLRAKCGIFLATATAEPFGLSVAEAMANGLPVVAAGAGGHLETVGRVAPDLLYPPGDIERCAALLTELAFDVDRRRRVGSELRCAQQEFLDLDRHVDRLVAIYRRHAKPDARDRLTRRSRR